MLTFGLMPCRCRFFCRNLQARLHRSRTSEHRLDLQSQLSEVQKRLQLDRDEMAEWETT